MSRGEAVQNDASARVGEWRAGRSVQASETTERISLGYFPVSLSALTFENDKKDMVVIGGFPAVFTAVSSLRNVKTSARYTFSHYMTMSIHHVQSLFICLSV